MRQKLVCLCLLAVFFVSACNILSATPTPVPTATLVPMDTATATYMPTTTSTATIMPSPTITPTPSPTHTPTLTQTPSPSPTPKGYYRSPSLGFALNLPNDWDVGDEETSYVQLLDKENGIFFVISSGVAGEEVVFADLVDEITDSALPGMKILSTGEEQEIALADGIKAKQIAVEAETTTNGQAVTIILTVTYVRHGSQEYVGMMYASEDAMSSLARTIDRLYASIQLFRPEKYDLSADETLYLSGYDPDPSQLDPALTGGSAQSYVGYLFSGLVRLNGQLQVIPDLAESWTVSDDGTVYTFKLRPGIKFSSGDAITAEDFKKCWERAADPETESGAVRTYLGDIVGVNEKLTGDADEVSGVKVIDEQTLEVTIDGAKPYFLAKLTYPTSYVYKIEEAESAPDTWVYEPSASGPYQLREYIENEVFIFELNPHYYAPPAIKYVAFQVLPSVSALSLYKDGVIDMVYLGGEDSEQVRKPEDPLHDQWQSTTSLCTSYIQLNNTKPPFDDPKVRQAFVQAIDRDTLNERIFNNTNLPALTILPPAMPGFSADLSIASYDVEAAKEALAASSYAGNMPAVILTLAGTAGNEDDYTNALIEMWKTNLGVQVKVEYVDPLKSPDSLREQHGQMVQFGWCADYPDPENFLDILFHSSTDFNVAEYTNPEVDALLEQARTELDPAKRLQLYQEVEAMLLNDFAVIPTIHSVDDMLVNPRVQGFTLSPMNSSFIHEISLASE